MLFYTACYCISGLAQDTTLSLPPDMGIQLLLLPLVMGVMSMVGQHCTVLYVISSKGQVKPLQLGGTHRAPLTYSVVRHYLSPHAVNLGPHLIFHFVDHVLPVALNEYTDSHHCVVNVPLAVLVQHVPVATAHHIAHLHGINAGSHATLAVLQQWFKQHVCECCADYTTVLSVEQLCSHLPLMPTKSKLENPDTFLDVFPPPPLNQKQTHQIIQSACLSMNRKLIEESGCAVCGQLTPVANMSPLSAMKNQLHVLAVPGLSCQERTKSSEKVKDLPFVIDQACSCVCLSCRAALCINKIPCFALAQGLWIGTVPEALASLQYVEKLLVARV
jgi:hypothetical protein